MTVDAGIADVAVFAGALAGGLVNGLTGFGSGMTALPIWLSVLPPSLASPLTVVCSVVGQLQTLRQIWHAMDFRRLLPFVVTGLVGVPLGVRLLPHIDARSFQIAVGILLVVCCSLLLAHGSHRTWSGGGRVADGAVGFVGGILGGLCGLSGVLPTMWAELRNWGKDDRRAVFQGYNLSILSFALVTQGVAGFMGRDFGRVLLIALPGTILGVWIGRRTYDRLDTRRFSRVVLIVLIAGGAVLLGKNVR